MSRSATPPSRRTPRRRRLPRRGCSPRPRPRRCRSRSTPPGPRRAPGGCRAASARPPGRAPRRRAGPGRCRATVGAVGAGVREARRERLDRGVGGGREQRGGADGERRGVERAQRAQDPRALGHRGVQPATARRGERDHGQRTAGAEAEADRERRCAGSPEHDADPGQRPHGEGEDERGEAEAEQHAVEPGRERHRQHAPPRLGHLPPHLRHDPRAPGLAGGRGERDRGRDDRRPAAERAPEQREPAERQHAAGERSGRERHARDGGRPQPPGIAGGRERLHHREPARRPRPGHAGDDARR